ncbi:hypothetical protein AT268_31730 [Bacillus cereus]|uniref:Uncharacterized protein n=1 Tax=Bacillus cereus TaxID=1396 RepID=A0A9X0MJZ0_BACCE|nr:hypothetical protein [Bacillus cereus]KXY51075.1 hypothetical protein AT268_31730 [Bacillus cereus]
MNLIKKIHEKGYRLVLETEIHQKTKEVMYKCIVEALTKDEMNWKYIDTIKAKNLIELEVELSKWIEENENS